MRCPSPHWRERSIYRLIWGETAKLFPEYHRHTIVHLHWIQIQVNSNSRLNDLQLPLTWPWLCKAAAPPSPVLGCPSHSLPLLVSLIIVSWKRLSWGSVRVWTHKPTHKPLVSEPHFGGAWGIAVSSEIQVSFQFNGSCWDLIGSGGQIQQESAFTHSSCPSILKTSSKRTTHKSRRIQQKSELLIFSSCAFFTSWRKVKYVH